MAKKVIDIKIGENPKSIQKAEYASLIEQYRIENPAKYEQKKASLEARLASMQ